MIYRNGNDNGAPIPITKTYRITGTGAINQSLLQVFGTIRVIDQFATIKSITTLVNATSIYATEWDGTAHKDLTIDGAVLSGLPVGTSFFKDQDVTQPYTVLSSAAGQVNELLAEKKEGKPFTIQQKNGVDTFINFHLTTTDAPIDFTVEIHFLYERKAVGSNLVFL